MLKRIRGGFSECLLVLCVAWPAHVQLHSATCTWDLPAVSPEPDHYSKGLKKDHINPEVFEHRIMAVIHLSHSLYLALIAISRSLCKTKEATSS